MAVLGCELVGLPRPTESRDLIVWLEIDRCAADAVQAVTGCRPGKRTLKLLDYGKLAATFYNQRTEAAVRVAARASSRDAANAMFPHAEGKDRYAAQVLVFCVLPVVLLFSSSEVEIVVPESELPGRPGSRLVCAACEEEVNDGREVYREGLALCRPCAGAPVYHDPFRMRSVGG